MKNSKRTSQNVRLALVKTRSLLASGQPRLVISCPQEIQRAILKGLHYLLDYVCMFYVYVMCMFCIVFNLCAKFEFVKSPEVTLCGWLGYAPTINNNICFLPFMFNLLQLLLDWVFGWVGWFEVRWGVFLSVYCENMSSWNCSLSDD